MKDIFWGQAPSKHATVPGDIWLGNEESVWSNYLSKMKIYIYFFYKQLIRTYVTIVYGQSSHLCVELYLRHSFMCKMHLCIAFSAATILHKMTLKWHQMTWPCCCWFILKMYLVKVFKNWSRFLSAIFYTEKFLLTL